MRSDRHLFTLLFALLLASPVQADQFESPDRTLERTLMRLFRVCADVTQCPNTPLDLQSVYVRETASTRGRDIVKTKLPSHLVGGLQKIADEQAQIWADTILEGEYFANGPTYLDSVEIVLLRGRKIGFRIGYSERGWDTSRCIFRRQSLESLRRCEEGRIQEFSFVTLDLLTWLRDDSHFARFIPQREKNHRKNYRREVGR